MLKDFKYTRYKKFVNFLYFIMGILDINLHKYIIQINKLKWLKIIIFPLMLWKCLNYLNISYLVPYIQLNTNRFRFEGSIP